VLVRLATLKSSHLLFEPLAQQVRKQHATQAPPRQQTAADQERHGPVLLFLVVLALFASVCSMRGVSSSRRGKAVDRLDLNVSA